MLLELFPMPIVHLSRRSLWPVVALAALATGACDRQSPAGEQPAGAEKTAEKAGPDVPLSGTLDISQRGKAAPDVSFKDPDGKTVTLAAFKGKPVLVNLWATWCGPCVVEMPTLDALAAREKDRLVVLTVSQDMQDLDKIAPFFAEKGFKNLQPYTDQENNLGFSYQTGVMPTTVLYDAQGKEVWRMIGGMDWNGTRASALMEETLAAKG
ncbi:TlpA family protein disulfide reductase [Sphingomonas ursincola]|jgi:thiol-disulfide isomerase/thioredoxin|uniref:TlpA family protein disulfide reductase n=2 Tax=Sphingomonas ursincola TaxID=56361 RepID=A0A7V8RG49_9SPHN|nr:TlpA family protein disulfide reductase [Sphingomonas ursincola]